MKYKTRFTCFSLSIAAFAILFSAFSTADERPNFILLMGDDHGWSETGYNGHLHLKTPILDEMAKTGLRFDNFYAAHPTCSPTRGSVLTGRHPNRYGTFHPGWSIRSKEITIAHVLAKVGYRCAHFGKWHLGPVKADSPTNPRAMGFHEFVSHDNFYEMDPVFSRNGGPPEQIKGEGSDVTINETMRFIDRATEKGKPFLAVVWFGSPHEPYSGLEKDLAVYDNLPASYAERNVQLTSMKTGRPTTRSLREVLRERYAEITAMDRAIGKLREHLKSKQLSDNTLVWYCGDNGHPPSSGQVSSPLRGEKAQMYEGGIRVPGLIEWPARIKSAKVTSVSAGTSDILPTICDLADIEIPSRPMDGISIVRLIDGDMSQRPTPICFWRYNSERLITTGLAKAKPYFSVTLQEGTTPLVKYLEGKLTRSFKNYHQPATTEEDYAGMRAIVDNRYKLVIDGDGDDRIELFDLINDRAEKSNLVDSEPDVAEKLKKQLRGWQTSVLESLAEKDYN